MDGLVFGLERGLMVLKMCQKLFQRDPHVTPIKKAYRLSTVSLCFYGADEVNRTPDPHITNVLLYRLSYIGINRVLYSEIRLLATSLSSHKNRVFIAENRVLAARWKFVAIGGLPAVGRRLGPSRSRF